MAKQFRMGPKASLAVAVSWAVVAHVAQAGDSVAHMNFATGEVDVPSAEIAGIAAANCTIVVEELARVDGCRVRMIVVATGKMEEASGVVCSIVQTRERERERARLAKRDSCRCYIVAARTVHAAAEPAEEAVRGNVRSDVRQAVSTEQNGVVKPCHDRSESYGSCFVDSCLVTVAMAGHLFQIAVTSLLLCFPRPL
jgi:hypothetical protein